jgi:hypothetical protein
MQAQLPPCRQQELAPVSEEGPRLSLEALRRSAGHSREAWQVYRSQAAFPASLALAMLYLTVMNFVSPAVPLPQSAASSR